MTFVLLAVLVAVGDIFLKNHFEKELQWGEERRICGGKVLLCRYHNRGVALDAAVSGNHLVFDLQKKQEPWHEAGTKPFDRRRRREFV